MTIGGVDVRLGFFIVEGSEGWKGQAQAPWLILGSGKRGELGWGPLAPWV